LVISPLIGAFAARLNCVWALDSAQEIESGLGPVILTR